MSMEKVNPNNLKDTEYLRAVVQKKPKLDDPKEVAIVAKIKEQALSSDWAREAIFNAKEAQARYLQEVLSKTDDSSFVYARTQEFLKQISELLKSEIMEGSELLAQIPKGSPALVMTNHLGLYKLAGINPRDLGVDIDGYDFMYPSPMYFGGLKPVAESIGDNLSYVSDDFPGVFGKIHRQSGFIHVPPPAAQKENRTEALLGQSREVLEKYKNVAVVNFPEGGTSGKYNGKGPYDLENFKTGGYVIASQLGIYVIPVAQYFDPKKGLRLRVFPPYVPEVTDKEGYQQKATRDQAAMQKWLDEQKSS